MIMTPENDVDALLENHRILVKLNQTKKKYLNATTSQDCHRIMNELRAIYDQLVARRRQRAPTLSKEQSQ